LIPRENAFAMSPELSAAGLIVATSAPVDCAEYITEDSVRPGGNGGSGVGSGPEGNAQ
jgi:hypothetical protein